MKKRVLCFLWALTASALCASPLDDADVAFYVEDYQKAIDMISEEESSAAQQSFLAACRIRRAAAALALAADGQEAVMTDKELNGSGRFPGLNLKKPAPAALTFGTIRRFAAFSSQNIMPKKIPI